MEDMTRREFVAAAAISGAALLHIGSAPAVGAETDPALAVLMRRNVYCMNDTTPTIVAYRNAIAVMRARPATDGTSWLAQANIHGSYGAPPGMITDACQHNPQFFLAWHRMYLHYFERIVRAASGDPNFSLPYWGYSPTGNRALPTMFRTPSTAANVLYTSQRSASVNAGTALSASVVDPGAALLQIAFTTFSSSLDSTPHGVVHTGVGGASGLMRYFETAGQDPILWLHHAHIDRLWELWLASGGGRANPTTSSWLTTSFQFYDETGATVSMTGAQIVDTAGQLSYRYASPLCLVLRPYRFEWRMLTRIPPIDPRALELATVLRGKPPLPDPAPIAVQESVRLGAGAADLRIQPTPEARRVLERFETTDQGGNALSVELDDIRLEQPAQVYYEVYLNLPAGVDTVYTNPHYVGNVDFFGPSPQGKHANMPLRRSLSLMPAYVRLRAAGRWKNDELRVTFVPRGYTEDQDPRRVLGNRGQAVIGRVTLRVE
jgi:hypothetical protein